MKLTWASSELLFFLWVFFEFGRMSLFFCQGFV